MDLNPLTTPNNILTDCLNGTIITYNGNEFVLQNDMGNCKVSTARLTPGFIPMGMKEYGGIIYVVSFNPITREGEVGSFPSPQVDFSTNNFNDLEPANFRTSEFILETNTTHESSTKHVGILNQAEIFELHPGDQYVITYQIHEADPGHESDPDNIDTVTKFNNYISKDPTNRKLFSLNYYKISSTNNLVLLDPTTINDIPYAPDIDSDYKFFTENSNSSLAVGMSVEQLDLFQSNVVDSSLAINSNKSVTIEAIGRSASLNDFEGVKLEVISPSTHTWYLQKQTGTQQVSAIVDGMSANDLFQCSLTPYSKYCFFPKLRQDFKLTLGQYLSAGSGVNDIFQWFTNLTTNTITVSFDFKFQGNTVDGLHLYIEFYDPWSDYSVIKRVDNPTFYGLNSVVLNLVNEPRVDQFDSTTVGGTPPSKLITNADTAYERTQLNSTNKIRTDQVLRKNHFYIVRVSGVDQSTSSGSIVYTHYDFYKGLYTTTMFNSIYTSQSALSVNDPNYVGDFNSLNFITSTIGYQTNITQSFSNILTPVSSNSPSITTTDPTTGIVTTTYPLMTNQDYYAVMQSAYTGDTAYKGTTSYETDVEYNVALTLQGTDQVFGNFKTNMLSNTFPTLLPSNDTSGGPGVKATITEATVPSTPATNSIASWTATAISGNNYKVDLKVTTDRSVAGVAIRDSLNISGAVYSEVPINQSFHYVANKTGALGDNQATIGIGAYSSYGSNPGNSYIAWYDDTFTLHSIDLGPTNSGAPDGVQIHNVIDSTAVGTKRWSALWGGAYRRPEFLKWNGAPGGYGAGNTPGLTEHMLFLRNDTDGTYCPCRCNNITVAIDFFNTLLVASNVTKTLYLYYPNPAQITFNGQITTTGSFGGADITTTFSPDMSGPSYIKTYLSTFRFRALNVIDDFDPTVLNSYIASNLSDSIIVDSKQTIRDGFIPFIDTPQTTQFSMNFSDIVISKASDSATLGAMQAGHVQGPQDPAFAVQGNTKPHGAVFIPDGTTKYNSFVGNFSAGNVTNGVTVDPATVYIHVTASSGQWQGGWAANGNNHFGGAPYLYQDLQIS